ncbi:MAG: hypothetical protein SVP26_04525 [Chloroflexota bacterium]|nr:hypothetical protein [Chloroflexota bacterium]
MMQKYQVRRYMLHGLLTNARLESHSSVPNARQRLDRGAMAFCVFAGRELGSIGWVAFSKEAQASLDEPPLPVDYESGEAYRGGVWTSPRYRGLGLHTYGNFKRCQFLVERGAPRWWGLIERGNTVSLRTNLKFAPVIESEGRYLRVLWWKSWKGRPLSPEMERELNAVRRAGGRRRQAEGRGAMAGTSRLSTG